MTLRQLSLFIEFYVKSINCFEGIKYFYIFYKSLKEVNQLKFYLKFQLKTWKINFGNRNIKIRIDVLKLSFSFGHFGTTLQR